MNNDCILCIFTMLGPKDIVNCLLVCKRFYMVAKNNMLWKQLFKEKFYYVCTSENDFYDNYKKYSILNNFLIKYCGISVNTNIKRLHLCHPISQPLPKEIGLLTMLLSLNLAGNILQTIPKEIGQLSMLQILQLSHNRLQEIPKEIGQLTNLRSLDLNANELQIIPKEIGQLKMLENLYLHNNPLQIIPKELGQLPMLQNFTLDKNLKNLIKMNNGLKIRYTQNY